MKSFFSLFNRGGSTFKKLVDLKTKVWNIAVIGLEIGFIGMFVDTSCRQKDNKTARKDGGMRPKDDGSRSSDNQRRRFGPLKYKKFNHGNH